VYLKTLASTVPIYNGGLEVQRLPSSGDSRLLFPRLHYGSSFAENCKFDLSEAVDPISSINLGTVLRTTDSYAKCANPPNWQADGSMRSGIVSMEKNEDDIIIPFVGVHFLHRGTLKVHFRESFPCRLLRNTSTTFTLGPCQLFVCRPWQSDCSQGLDCWVQ